MPRQPRKAAEIHAEPGPLPESHAITLAEEVEAKATEAEMAFEAAKTVGQIEASLFYATVADKVIVETFLKLKKNKAYRTLTVKGPDGKPRRVADLEEFCEHFLGRSARRVQELASQYQMLGADLYEQAQLIGFRNQDYRALKSLPAEDQEVIKQAMQTDDRDQVLDLLQEIAARHASEKEALIAEATEAKETAEARDQVVKAKESKISQLEETNNKLKRRQAKFTDIEHRDYECAPLHDTINDAMLALAKMATEVKHLVEEVGGETVTDECFNAVLLPIKRALEIAAHNRLHIDLATLTSDDHDEALNDLQTRAAGLNLEARQ